jgi:glycosyltransferase involved in cell wall biosynthesis
MILGVDAANIRMGGGLAHLYRILEAGEPHSFGIDSVRVWGNRRIIELLGTIPAADWLDLHHVPALDKSLPFRLFWQHFRLPALARQDCDLLFAPGGSATAVKQLKVAMSQNMLPFESSELRRYAISLMFIRLLLLRSAQRRTFESSGGIIFLTDYARRSIMRQVKMQGRIAVIPHGIDERFFRLPKIQRPIGQYSIQSPYRLVYVSTIDMYKHQWNVASAVSELRRQGIPLTIDFVGPAYPKALRRLRRRFAALDPDGDYLRYRGPVPFESIHEIYDGIDLFLFASSCENLPVTLLEGMAGGFPIACSNRGPMPEILGDAGSYFDPESPHSIRVCLEALILDPELRRRFATAASTRARTYSWRHCSAETLKFLASICCDGRLELAPVRQPSSAPRRG